MEFNIVIAIVRLEALEKVEARMQEIGVRGISVTKVKGYGEYKNFYSKDWMVSSARIEIFAGKARARDIAAAIMEVAHSGLSGDGIVAIMPVETVFRIRTRHTAAADHL